MPGHERHLAVHFADEHAISPAAPRLLDERQQIGSHVRIRAEAELRSSRAHPLRHEMGDDVHASRHDIADDVRVVRAQVILLGVGGIEHRPGLEKELDDANVWRHIAPSHGVHVLELRIVAEHTGHDRLEQPPLEIRPRHGLAQRERRDDGEIDRGIACRAPIELVRDRVRLADPERQREDDSRAQPAQHGVHALADIIQGDGHALIRPHSRGCAEAEQWAIAP